MIEVDRELLAIAEQQYSAVTRGQCLTLGLSPSALERRVANGRLECLFPGVYRISGSQRSGRQLAMAAHLWLGEQSAVSHMTAGTLLKLDGVNTRELHMSVPRDTRRRVTSQPIHVHRPVQLARVDLVSVQGLPSTSATRTVIDCAEYLRAEALEVAFESARRMGLTSPRALAQRADALCGRGKPGSAAIKELLASQREGDPALQFRLEVKTARLLRAHKLPTPVRQFALGKYRIDFAYPPRRVGLECEGFEYHGNRLTWKRDKRRTAWIEGQDWRLVFLTWDDVTKRPEETIERIRYALK
jgi:very-short-patch-repair endonuclease